jgi:hypothetical protein
MVCAPAQTIFALSEKLAYFVASFDSMKYLATARTNGRAASGVGTFPFRIVP